MEKSELILLPGLKRQIRFLIQKSAGQKYSNVLIIGSSSEVTALKFINKFNSNVEIIVGEYESLINSKYILGNSENVNIKMMSYDSTDYPDNHFDLVYAQASISLTNRNKIVKEIKRILKPSGYLCVGEIVSFEKEIPRFVQDIYNNSDLLPLFINDLEKYYKERKFIVLAKEDLSTTLKEYYSMSIASYNDIANKFDSHEQSYYKKIINKIKHESNVYLKLGGDKYIGFIALLLKKDGN
ncbi:MAG: methyltransferase domain-containing protein [Melioribacteraceae bacterium]|nr:methyltransferase domain-containing protein [Melioribacteraceae bacterium]